MTAAQDAWPAVLFTNAFKEKIKAAKVLAVGAGGIGCELLKTLVLTGFENIEVIDLDTIETSNLNRQFLFRRSHVGQSKAKVAADVVKTFAPQAKITSYQANIKEARFSLDFFKSFDLVLNGLDNMDARRHVNRLCIAAGVPLVESGTAGYVGQVSVHLKDKTECYECNPRTNTTQKTYPICTLRNTPDKPIHCVVWAKELLFPRLFGKVEISDLDEQSAAAPTSTAALEPAANGNAAAAANGDEAAAAAAAAEAAEVTSCFKRREAEQPLEYAKRVFERLYSYDIEKVLQMEELWKTRKPPTPLKLAQLLPDIPEALSSAMDSTSAPAASKALGLPDQAVWPVADSARVFLASIVKYLTQREEELGEAVFDKDDDLAVDFVTAASNLRAACYEIGQQSRFDCKGMAGNIIHAIATTNAIVGGIIVVEALKLLAAMPEQCVATFVRSELGVVGTKRKGLMKCLISGEVPAQPNKNCIVCGKAALHLTVNTDSMTLQQLIEKVLKKRLGFNKPSIDIGTTRIWDEAELDYMEPDEVEAERAQLPKALSSTRGGGVHNGTLFVVDDDTQKLSVEVHVTHQDVVDADKYPDGFVLQGEAPTVLQEQPAVATEPTAAAAAEPAAAATTGKKRTREEEDSQQQQEQSNDQALDQQPQHDQQEAEQQPAKRQKQQQDDGAAAAGVGTGDEPVELLDSDDDCIVVD